MLLCLVEFRWLTPLPISTRQGARIGPSSVEALGVLEPRLSGRETLWPDITAGPAHRPLQYGSAATGPLRLASGGCGRNGYISCPPKEPGSFVSIP